MKIKTNSWHYKLAELFSQYSVSDSLCLYFWQVIGGMFVALFGVSFIILVGSILLSPVLMFFSEWFADIGVPICYLYLIIVICYLLKNGVQKSRNVGFVDVSIEWVAAKKNRVCPRLEFE